ncbi:hypothetical protein EMIHUDRAFT_359096 [Emiliania huxleyi CCMP1516]|uniref:NOSIC domain-containing protein n=2 Tax=Emiliania huxleyi TaxID=2903 RepID=A0A0D3I9K8_EMIH1|nr:hypothetical protein EMIHUDRAFT_359096 [Emiliania huxleyi CCMP1516]EOD07943.1 hypothetical protein EMIHUDRAFT_359096 [Emiliania huxleyi CCMP1516]|eukprot:XP_005760372.1 hypothetical protein EMIHUDRAFT_359096 [Emiliania huxleyi CCMP1516]
MASLDAFLADLDDLNEEEDEGEEEEIIEEEDDDDGDIDMLAETGGGGGAAGTSGLLASSRMASLMEKIEAYMVADAGDGVVAPPAAPQDDAGAVYALIVQCNEIAVDIDNEVEALAKHIRDDYAKRFPELESLIPNPLDFARVVLKIGNEADLTQVDLTGILPSATIMVVTVTSSTTIGTELPPQALAAVSERCEQVLALSDNKQRILAFVESKMARDSRETAEIQPRCSRGATEVQPRCVNCSSDRHLHRQSSRPTSSPSSAPPPPRSSSAPRAACPSWPSCPRRSCRSSARRSARSRACPPRRKSRTLAASRSATSSSTRRQD